MVKNILLKLAIPYFFFFWNLNCETLVTFTQWSSKPLLRGYRPEL